MDTCVKDGRALYDAVWNKADGAEVSRILDANPTLINAVIDEEWQAGVLHCAIEKGLSQIVKQLLERENIDVNMRNINSCTPLYYSCSFGHADLAELLLKSKARTDLCRKVTSSIVSVRANERKRERTRERTRERAR